VSSRQRRSLAARRLDDRGLTLVELLLSVAVMGIIAGAVGGALTVYLDAHEYGTTTSELHFETMRAMELMTNRVRRSTFVLIPNGHQSTRNILAVSGFVNDDNDYYFGDPLFPKYDEDLSDDMNEDNAPGLAGYDDDGDGHTDETAWGGWYWDGQKWVMSGGTTEANDDEDGSDDEDPLNGVDDDLDGSIDEDFGIDANDDGEPGIADMDDDGDGFVDEGYYYDDDEDGSTAEIGLRPVIYKLSGETLQEIATFDGTTINVATGVKTFQVDLVTPDTIKITISIQAADGQLVTVSEYVHVENVYQKIGKRVR